MWNIHFHPLKRGGGGLFRERGRILEGGLDRGFNGKISQHLGAVLKTHAPYHSTFNVNANVDYQIFIW